MRESVAALDFQVQLIDEREKRLVVYQKLLDFHTKSGVFLAFKKEAESESVGIFKLDESLGATFRQSEANRRILRNLLSLFTPIFHQGDVRWTSPAHATVKVGHIASEGLTQPFVLHFQCI